jgi:hypothetical protein
MIYSKSCTEKSSCRQLGRIAYEGRRVWGLEWVTHTENSEVLILYAEVAIPSLLDLVS